MGRGQSRVAEQTLGLPHLYSSGPTILEHTAEFPITSTCSSLPKVFLWPLETVLEGLRIHTSQEQPLGSVSGNLVYIHLCSPSLW